MTDIDLDAMTERAHEAARGYVYVDHRHYAADVPQLLAEVRRLTTALGEWIALQGKAIARAERAEADALAQRSIATREAQERRDHQDRADRQAAALREVGALADEADATSRLITAQELRAAVARSGAVERIDGCACCSWLGACFIEHQHGCDGGHGKRERCNNAARHAGGGSDG